MGLRHLDSLVLQDRAGRVYLVNNCASDRAILQDRRHQVHQELVGLIQEHQEHNSHKVTQQDALQDQLFLQEEELHLAHPTKDLLDNLVIQAQDH